MRKDALLLIGGLAFALLCAIAILKQHYEVLALPFVIGVVYLSLKRLDILLLAIVFFTPLSLNLEDLEMGGIGFYFPTEPLLFGVLGIFILKILSGKSIDPVIYKHPIAIFTYVFLGWTFFTSLTSEMPVVSFKFLLAKMWYIGPMFFLLVHIFKKKENMDKFILLYVLSLMIVIIYTVIQHSGFGFDKQSGHVVMKPFFKDHTSYGAVIAMFLPVIVGKLFSGSAKLYLRIFMVSAFIVILVGLILSYTRAAWVSVIAGAAIFFVLWLRIKLNAILATLVLMIGFFFVFQDQILINLERNDQDSSDNLTEHAESISNVSTDASNLERLNRWNCALEMWKERPILGWGPGVYQFVYAPFQRSNDLTIISTNNADLGNAHSEYLGPLSEQGLPGMLIMIALVYLVTAMSFRMYFTQTNKETRVLLTSVYIGLMTYFIHGLVNNYLDSDKASVPFWGFLAILVAIDLFHSKKASARLDLTAE